MKKLIALIFIATIAIANGQTLQLDPNFGNNGFATLPMNSNGDSFIMNKTQSDGKIIVSGTRLNGSISEDFIARYNQDGSIDTTFAVNGFYIINDSINDNNGPVFFILNNDSILCIISNVNGEITKLNANGTIDNSFGNNGKMNFNYFGSTYLDINDNLYIGTGTGYQLIRINTTSGTIDTSFGTNGILILENTPFVTIDSFKNNKFLVRSFKTNMSTSPITYSYNINQFLIDGSLDTTFGTNGTLTLHTTTNLYDFDNLKFFVNVDLNNGELYITESNSSTISSTTKKYDSNGNQIVSFGASGIITIPLNNYISNVKFYNNKIYFSGINSNNGAFNTSILRYSLDGIIDTTFNNSGLYIENTNSLVEWAENMSINPNGSIIVCGEYINGTYNKIYIAKYIESNLMTPTFDKDFNIKYQNPIENKIDFLSNKSISSITLYNIDGKQIAYSKTNYMNVENIDKGIYVAKIISSENETKIIKIIKN